MAPSIWPSALMVVPHSSIIAAAAGSAAQNAAVAKVSNSGADEIDKGPLLRTGEAVPPSPAWC